MTEPSMTLSEYLRKIGTNLEGDFLREGLALLAQMAMDLEVTQQIVAAERRADEPAQRDARTPLGHAGGADRAADPQAAPRQLLSQSVGTAAAYRKGVAECHPAGVHRPG